MEPLGIAFVFAGLFSAAGGAMDWDFFMNHPKARFMCRVLGRNGARVFYVLFGAAFTVFGVLYALGVIRDAK